MLPDGGREFVLADPDIAFLAVNFQTRLQFGKAELVIETPFTLTTNDGSYALDPNHRDQLGPLLGIYPDRVERLVMSPNGRLTATFVSGVSLTVEPNDHYEAWNIDGFWCPPGGF